MRTHAMVSRFLPEECVAVQCIYFEKSEHKNCLVPLHQDLVIPVQKKVDHASLTGWSEKDGSIFVQPPVDILQRLVAVRLHLDACAAADGPLRVVPGSHRIGRIPHVDALDHRDRTGEHFCLVSKDAALVMRPLLLHASSKATGASKRRVLHFVFGPRTLPFGLAWESA